MRYDRETSIVSVSVTEIASHVMRSGDINSGGGRGGGGGAEAGNVAHRIRQSQMTGDVYSEEIYNSEVTLSVNVLCEGINFIVNGRADGVIITPEGDYIIEEIKSVGYPLEFVSADMEPAHFAQGLCYAYMLCVMNGCDKAETRLTYVSQGNGEARVFSRKMEREALKEYFYSLLSAFAPFAELAVLKGSVGVDQLKKMRFPFSSIRDGQKDFILETHRTIKKKRRLLVTAPTGIGKTMSALFPSVKSIGEGLCDKVFYLTAKTVTGIAALEASKKICEQAPMMRCVMITARERACPGIEIAETDMFDFAPPKRGKDGKLIMPPKNQKNQKSGVRGESCNPMLCPRAAGHYDRVNGAIIDILRNHSVLDRELIAEYAERHMICPYEFSLDLSEFCDVIICDYNYLFDPQVSFQRYFKEVEEEYVFLIDEAHNLTDRAREMYSADLRLSEFREIENLIGEQDFITQRLIESTIKKIETMKKFCEEDMETSSDGTETGFYMNSEIPVGLGDILEKFMNGCDEMMRQNGAIPRELILLYFRVREFIKIFEVYDKKHTTYIEVSDGDIFIRLLCLDPSELLNNALKKGRASVFFSATLTPLDYFADILGCNAPLYHDHVTLELESPYEKDNLCLCAVDTVSTKYADREQSADEIATLICASASGKTGNYIAYFPSYKYMTSVYRIFCTKYPHIKTVIQKPSMSEESRQQFLDKFAEDKNNTNNLNPNNFNNSEEKKTMVGFCVLGGVFSEGIDLQGEMLVGAIIVGVGLPGISSELNIIRDYYESTRENGFEYAYVFPGMNKVLQAAGRVIRGENDKGIIVLIDDRFGTPRYRELFPSHWKHLMYTGNPKSLYKIIKKFWETGK